MRQFYFEKMDVWQRSKLLVKAIYQLSKTFPSDEKFGMTSQIRRACISITCNIAEGSSRHSGKDQARFTELAFGSLLEVLNLLIAASDLEYITEDDINIQRPLIEEISNKLNALRETQLKRP